MPYPWPASAISEDEMALLYRAREASVKHMPITELLRRAITEVYGQRADGATLTVTHDNTHQAHKAA
jgi:hypothetical protein